MSLEVTADQHPVTCLVGQADAFFQTMLASAEGYRQLDKSGLTPEQNASAIIRLSHLRDLISLLMAEHSAALDRSEACLDWGSTSTVDWIRHKGKLSWGSATDCVNVGRELPNLPKSVEALATGTIGFGHLSIIARNAAVFRGSESAEPFDESHLLRVAEKSSVGRLWYHFIHLRHRFDPQAVADDQRDAAESRYLQLTEGDDGWLFIKGGFDSIAKSTILTAIEALARPSGEGDNRCRERRQADALLELSDHALDTGAVPQHASVRPHLQVTTTLETLQGLVGAPAGEMALSLPISAKTVQRIACDSSVTRVLLGANSAVIDAGRAKRVVAGNIRRLLDARDQHCRWPGCERPASWSSAHHVIHWAQGGNTDLANMILLCHHHHWEVHEGGWRLSLSGDGRVLAIPPDTEFYPSELYSSEVDPSARAPDEFDVA